VTDLEPAAPDKAGTESVDVAKAARQLVRKGAMPNLAEALVVARCQAEIAKAQASGGTDAFVALTKIHATQHAAQELTRLRARRFTK
jgi:hypothetical protein